MPDSTKKLATASLMAAFTCIATMVIKIPTPTFGYIHLGDGLVLLCGIALGPSIGALSAGIGSMLADIFNGYVSWAPATLLIKSLTAGAAGLIFHKLNHRMKPACAITTGVIISGLTGEAIMVSGYFLYETALAVFSSGGFTEAAFYAGAVSAASGIPFNIVQGITGIVICIAVIHALRAAHNNILGDI